MAAGDTITDNRFTEGTHPIYNTIPSQLVDVHPPTDPQPPIPTVQSPSQPQPTSDVQPATQPELLPGVHSPTDPHPHPAVHPPTDPHPLRDIYPPIQPCTLPDIQPPMPVDAPPPAGVQPPVPANAISPLDIQVPAEEIGNLDEHAHALLDSTSNTEIKAEPKDKPFNDQGYRLFNRQRVEGEN